MYNFFLKVGKNSDPEFKAVALLSIIECIYLGNLIFLLNLLGINITNFINTKILGILISIPFLLFNYWLFVYKDKYIKLEESYNNHKYATKKINGLLTIIFIVMAFVVLALLIYLNMIKK